MTLADFLLTADADDALALAAAQAHTETQGKLIPRNTMNSILAQAGMYNAFLLASPTDDLIAAFMDVSSTEYNFIQGNATGDGQIAALDTLIAGGYPQLAGLKPVLIGLCNTPFNPFADATIEQVKAIRDPATMAAVTNPAEAAHVVSQSNKGGFRFTITAAEAFKGNVEIEVQAKNQDTLQYIDIPQAKMIVPLDMTAGQTLAHVLQRGATLTGYRHFKFTYKAPYGSAVTSVSVESVG